MLAGAARARAALDGRDFVIPDDVKALAPALLRHRVILSPAAEINGRKVEEIVTDDHRDHRGAALIYPTRTAVIATAAGAPFALAFAPSQPGRWFLALAWPLAMVLLTVFDALRGMAAATARVDLPGLAYVGETRDCTVTVSVGSRPRNAWVALQLRRWSRWRMAAGAGAARRADAVPICLPLEMLRRGIARFEQLWLRWTGPLGLAWQQATVRLDASFPVLPDLRPGARPGRAHFRALCARRTDRAVGRGEGSDFDALVDFRTGMDRRAIDWKQSARHVKLLAKQYRTERNNQIVFAIDTGRQMCEPVAGMRGSTAASRRCC